MNNEFLELTKLADELNLPDEFPVVLEYMGYINSFCLRVVPLDKRIHFEAPFNGKSGSITSTHKITDENCKAAQNWLKELHCEIIEEEYDEQ